MGTTRHQIESLFPTKEYEICKNTLTTVHLLDLHGLITNKLCAEFHAMIDIGGLRML